MRINNIPVVQVDYETELIVPGAVLPRPAIATTYVDPHDQVPGLTGAQLWLTRQLDGLWTHLLDLAISGAIYIGGHDVARFDCNVTAAHFPHLRAKLREAFRLGRIVDTIQAERIIEIHRHLRAGAGLDDLCRKYGVRFADKSDESVQAIRLSFGQFIGAEYIPPAHAEYALHDAIAPDLVLARQFATQLVDPWDLGEFCRRAYNGGRVAARGFRTDPERVEKLDQMVGERITWLEGIAREYGFLRTDRDGSVHTNKKAVQIAVACDYSGRSLADVEAAYTDVDRKSKAAMVRAQKRELERVELHPDVPRTDPSEKFPNGQVKTDRLTLEDASDPKLQALAEYDQLKYIRNKDIKIFRDGAVQPVQARFTIVDTTRFATSNPQVHNFGKAKGVRECIAARPGFALVVSDFKMLELVGLAQLCVDVLGRHDMARKIRDGVDMHAEIGADVLGCTYEEIQRLRKAGDAIAEEARDSGKPANFGLNGGMTDLDTYILYARKSYHQMLCEQQPGESNAAVHERRRIKAAAIVEAWKRRAVDQQAWIQHVARTRNAMGRYDMKHPGFRNLWRRGLSKTEATNNPFQIIGANCSHLALGYVLDAQYVPAPDGGPGPMWGSFVVMTTHDDIVSEVPLSQVAEHAAVQEELMAKAARETFPGVFLSDTPLKRIVDTRVLTHLSKSAPATRTNDGALALTAVAMPDSLR